jgi:hypothetical protein
MVKKQRNDCIELSINGRRFDCEDINDVVEKLVLSWDTEASSNFAQIRTFYCQNIITEKGGIQ